MSTIDYSNGTVTVHFGEKGTGKSLFKFEDFIDELNSVRLEYKEKVKEILNESSN